VPGYHHTSPLKDGDLAPARASAAREHNHDPSAFHQIGVPVPARPRPRNRQMKLFEKDAPDDSIQIDVKVVTLNAVHRARYLHALSRSAPVLTAEPALEPALLGRAPARATVCDQKMRSDKRHRSRLRSSWPSKRPAIHHRYIKPRRPEQNGTGVTAATASTMRNSGAVRTSMNSDAAHDAFRWCCRDGRWRRS